jgi:pimeloyl-ACP methyl ester carboxylesterase
MLEQGSRPGTFSPAEIDVYRQAWAQPGALTGMLNWYRALWLRPPQAPVRIEAPTLIAWGDRDVALQASLAEACAERCARAEVVHIGDAGHFVQHEAAERVDALLLDFLGRP